MKENYVSNKKNTVHVIIVTFKNFNISLKLANLVHGKLPTAVFLILLVPFFSNISHFARLEFDNMCRLSTRHRSASTKILWQFYFIAFHIFKVALSAPVTSNV